MQKLASTTLAIFLLVSCAGQSGDSSEMALDELLSRHAEARGGMEALQSIQNISVDLDITEPSFTVRGEYVATREGFMRIDIYADNRRVFTEAIGPDGAWQMNADNEVTDVSPEGRAALERGLVGNLYALHELPGLGYDLTLVGDDMRDGVSYWMIEKTTPDGFPETLYLNKETFLIERSSETSALHPDMDATKARFESIHSEFRESGGVLFSGKSVKTNLETGEIVQTTVVTDRQINPDIKPALFARPQ